MLRYLLEKEFKQILRHRFLPRVILFMPLMMLGILPFAANQEVKEVRVAVLDNDHSTTSRRLIEKIEGSGYFQLVALPKSYQEALQGVEAGETDIILELPHDLEKRSEERRVEAGETDIILELPHDLEKAIVQGEGSQVLLAANAVNGTRGILGSTYLSSVLHDYASELRQAGVGNGERGAYTALPTFTLQSQYQFNPHLDYKAFMVPGLMVMLLTMLTGFLPALNIVGEKETGTIEQMNVSPVRPWTLILSKLIPYWTLGLFVLMLAMGLAATLFGLTPAGGIGNILAFTLLYLLVMSGLGICVSNIAGTMQQAMFVMYFFMMLFFLMSGLFTPITSMPQWAQMLTYLNPLRYFVQAMRSIYLKGSGLMDLLPQLGALAVYALASCSLALLSYRKRS